MSQNKWMLKLLSEVCCLTGTSSQPTAKKKKVLQNFCTVCFRIALASSLPKGNLRQPYLFHLARVNDKYNIIDCYAGFCNIRRKNLQWKKKTNRTTKTIVTVKAKAKQITAASDSPLILAILRMPEGGVSSTFFWSKVCTLEWSMKTWYLTRDKKHILRILKRSNEKPQKLKVLPVSIISKSLVIKKNAVPQAHYLIISRKKY